MNELETLVALGEATQADFQALIWSCTQGWDGEVALVWQDGVQVWDLDAIATQFDHLNDTLTQLEQWLTTGFIPHNSSDQHPLLTHQKPSPRWARSERAAATVNRSENPVSSQSIEHPTNEQTLPASLPQRQEERSRGAQPEPWQQSAIDLGEIAPPPVPPNPPEHQPSLAQHRHEQATLNDLNVAAIRAAHRSTNAPSASLLKGDLKAFSQYLAAQPSPIEPFSPIPPSPTDSLSDLPISRPSTLDQDTAPQPQPPSLVSPFSLSSPTAPPPRPIPTEPPPRLIPTEPPPRLIPTEPPPRPIPTGLTSDLDLDLDLDQIMESMTAEINREYFRYYGS